MADQWYFAHGNTKFGPYSAAQLRELAAAGQIQLQDTVWKEGMKTGVAAARVNKLFAAAAVTAPPAGSGDPVTPGLSPPPAPSERPPPPDPPADAEMPLEPPAPQPTPLQLRLASPEELELAPNQGPVWAPASDEAEAAEPAEPAEVVLVAERGPPPPSETVKKWRVCDIRGGIIRSQDGTVVRYTKKCLRCGYVDLSAATAPIRGGATRATFFCPKCRKQQTVEIHAKQA